MAAAPPRRRIGIEMFGVSFVVDTRLETLASALASRLPPSPSRETGRACARRYVADSAGSPDGELLIRCGARQPARAGSVEHALDLIVTDLQRTLAHRADGLVFVHAGVVTWRGRALVLPGRSRSGKSELVAALLRAGAGYLSDEFAVFDGDGLVHPYARPLALRHAGGTRRVPAEALGARVASGPVAPSLIAFLRFSPASRGRTRRLSAGQTLLGLLRHTVAARRRLPLVRSVLVPVASSVSAVSGVRGEADGLAASLLRSLEASARPSALRTFPGA
jgi:hypothetical protein